MADIAKSAAALSLLLAIAFPGGGAQAFSMNGASAALQPQTNGALIGYAQDGSAAGSDGTMLSSAEIDHIRWCAARYRSYDPTADTFVAPGGNRAACRSPH